MSAFGSSARHVVQRLRVGAGVQLVRVVIVEPGRAIAIGAALGGHDDTGESAVLGAVRVRQHLHFLDRVEPRGGVGELAEDAGARRLAVLDVRRAVGAAAEELDAVEPADDVRVEREEVLDVAAVAR